MRDSGLRLMMILFIIVEGFVMSEQTDAKSITSFSLSLSDAVLLETAFQIADPKALSNVRSLIPPLSEVAIDKVEGTYEVSAQPWERNLWIRCCECGRDQNHKKGFVLRFVDGSRATVGKDCARVEHSLEFDDYLKTFETRRDRALEIRRFLLAVDLLPSLARSLRRAHDDPGILAALRLRHELESRFPDFFAHLAKSSQGRIIGPQRRRDIESEKLRDDRLDRKLDDLARRRGLSRGNADSEQALFQELRASGNSDTSKEPLWIVEKAEIGRFAGSGLITKISQLRADLLRIADGLEASLKSMKGRSSDTVTDAQMVAVRQKFLWQIDAALLCHKEIARAMSFAEAANVENVVRILNSFKDVAKLIVRDGRIARVASNQAEVAFILPNLVFAPAEFENAKMRIQNIEDECMSRMLNRRAA